MDIPYDTFLNMSWLEFDYRSTGYLRRIERQWDYTRHLIASNFNSSGFSKKTVKPTEIMKLPTLDRPTSTVLEKVSPERLKHMLNLLN